MQGKCMPKPLYSLWHSNTSFFFKDVFLYVFYSFTVFFLNFLCTSESNSKFFSISYFLLQCFNYIFILILILIFPGHEFLFRLYYFSIYYWDMHSYSDYLRSWPLFNVSTIIQIKPKLPHHLQSPSLIQIYLSILLSIPTSPWYIDTTLCTSYKLINYHFLFQKHIADMPRYWFQFLLV